MNTTLSSEDHLTIAFLTKYPVESARILESRTTQISTTFLSSLSPQTIAHVLQYTLPHATLAFLHSMPDQTVTDILDHMTPTAAVTTLHFADRTWRAGILGKMNSRQSAAVLKAFSFEEGTAGRLANPHVPILTADRTVSDAIQWIQNHQYHGDNYLYIVNRQHNLLGYVSIRDLLINDLDLFLESITTPALETLPAHLSFEQMLNSPSWLTYHTLPVVDSHHTFLGTISYQSLLTLKHVTHRTEPHETEIMDTSQAVLNPTLNGKSNVPITSPTILTQQFDHESSHATPEQST